MTVPQENEDADFAKYDKLQFVEFLEMIGRVAEYKFRGTELEDIGLERKIEQILDDIFIVLGKEAKRKLVEVEYEENTQSDSDYWNSNYRALVGDSDHLLQIFVDYLDMIYIVFD